MNVNTLTVFAWAVAAGVVPTAFADQQSEATGFVEGSKLKIKARNMYMNRDNRAESATQSYGEEWAQGFIGTYESGFTQGTVGFGLDAIGLLGLKLDTGGGRTGGGTGLLEQDHDGAKDSQSTLGAAVKMRVSNTVLKFGDQIVNNPVFATSDSRLLPETAQGLLITSSEIAGLKLQGGHFTALKNRNQSSHDSARLTSIDFGGGSYTFTDNLLASLYYSDVEDYWRKYYGSLTWGVPLSGKDGLKLDFNLYDTKSVGEKLGGELNNRIWSLTAAYTFGAHTVLVGRQQVSGTGDYKYGVDGNSTVFVGNSIQYSDFNYADEKSWQARYDLNMAPYGVPGLGFMARYVKGTDFDTATTKNGKAWERNIEARYVVQSGQAKDLSFRLRHASYRSADRGGEIDEVRLIAEYPFNIL
ncbi:OprD family porin [Pseudomonas sp. LP_7_YM]|uniref:OprD family porin n=1 Tax=Pseudomonas sp. LP_7_YM TaxID=2485137 RepID=UPI00105EB04A|nr:OprD family porin [Pseudomonas sp. LP_7_YM]TDV59709.1 imipenem/basic amino acid-specific outer membrane pore [Pseudomonas sp. LP_7_YM]